MVSLASPENKITLSVIKADVGSVGGHTKPSPDMMRVAHERLMQAIADGIIIVMV